MSFIVSLGQQIAILLQIEGYKTRMKRDDKQIGEQGKGYRDVYIKRRDYKRVRYKSQGKGVLI